MRMTLSRHFCASHSANPSWWLLMTGMVLFWSDMVRSETFDFYHAVVSYSYLDAKTNELISGPKMDGTYGLGNKPETEIGRLIHVQTSEGEHHGCSLPVNVPPDIKWIALIERGRCKFNDKVYYNAVKHNASAVIIYNHVGEDVLITMQHDYVEDVVSVFLHKEDGESLARLIDTGHQVKINITVGHIFHHTYNTSTHGSESPAGGKSNVLLATSLCFIVLLIFGLIGLLVYAVRRSKYIQNKNRTPMVEPCDHYFYPSLPQCQCTDPLNNTGNPQKPKVFALQETAQAQETLLTVESQLMSDTQEHA